MANNEEKFCNFCNRETLFFLESDMIWYCDECDNPYGSEALMEEDSEEFQEKLELFEEENGDAIYCKYCGNFVVIDEALEDEICPICSNELDDIQLKNKGYFYDEDKEIWIKSKN